MAGRKETIQHVCGHWQEYDRTGIAELEWRKKRDRMERRRCPECAVEWPPGRLHSHTWHIPHHRTW